MFLIFLLYAIFAGMTFINTSLMESDPYPLLVGMFRALGSGVAILGYMFFAGQLSLKKFRLSSEQWLNLLGYGILVHAFAMSGFSYGVMYANPVKVCFLYAAGPFITAILLYFYQGIILSYSKIAGLIIGLMGLIPILFKNISDIENFNAHNEWLGNSIVLISMIFFSFGWILFKKLIHSYNYSVQILNGIAMVLGGILSAIVVILVHGLTFSSTPFSANFNFLLFLFVASSLITYCLYAYLIKKFSPTFISFAGFLEPAFAVFYGILFFNYQFYWTDVLGFMILFLGLYIFYREELKIKKEPIK